MTTRPFRAAGEPLPPKPPTMPLPPQANMPPRIRKPIHQAHAEVKS
jgi:hypothetical protein